MFGSFSSAAAATVMAPPAPLPKYDVFLSFRGVDTRNNFTTYLYDRLCKKKIETFMDNKINRGDEISDELSTAIEESMIYVVIFSKNYASSSWCLKELVKIMECKEKYKRHAIPVFYHVEPSTVRYQAEGYKKWYHSYDDKEIRSWADALTKTAGLSGTLVNDSRPETMFVDGIVEDILKKLNRSFSSTTDQGVVGLGIDKHIAQIESLLQLESSGVQIIGIWGIGGIGKTTLARALHKHLATSFSSSSCIINTQQEIERVGTDSLQKKILSELLQDKIICIDELHDVTESVNKSKDVLLILDDMKNSSQVQELIGGRGNFGEGSRIIVTSRDMYVLRNAEVDGIYEVKEMNPQDSLQLFSLNAFKQNCPVKGYVDLVEKVLQYARGVPLALEVLGSLLYGRTRKEWESELQKLEKLPHVEIFNVLKLSYDGLDDEQKDIFLDIACFYRGYSVDEAVDLLDNCGFSAHIGVDVLKDRCLVSILEDRIMVHDIILEMGMEIVRQQCVDDPGKRSRLWNPEEIYHVLGESKGTDAIQCIFLDMSLIRKVKLHSKVFKGMPNMRILYFFINFESRTPISNVMLPAFLESLPDGLKVLHWDGFPLRSLPVDFYPENLIKLHMRVSHLEQLWEDDKELPNLKSLDLTNSSELIRIPDLSKFPNIEEIVLSGCKSLAQVYSSRFLSKLKRLWLDGCVELGSIDIPSNILSRSVGEVRFTNCRKLKKFSIYGTGVVDDDARCLDEQYLTELGSFGYGIPFGFCCLYLGNCESLTSLPVDLYKLKLLTRLNLSGCSHLKKFPEIKKTMENLAALDLSRTAIKKLPSSLHRLVGLQELSLYKCLKLQTIPSSIGRLAKLCELNLSFCESLETFPSSIFKLKLKKLDLSGCLKLKTFPEILEPAESFAHIDLSCTAVKELPSSLDCLVSLETLCLGECCDLESLPNSIGNLNLLSELNCSWCPKLTEIPNDIGRLSSLRKLSLQYTGIVNLPESIAHLSSMESLDVSDCRNLECIPQLPPFLKELLAFNCPSIRSMMPNSRFKHPSDSKEGTFEITNLDVIECGICPLYTKDKDDIGSIDKYILRKLNRSFSSTDQRMIGIDNHIAEILSLLQLDSAGVRIIGIWGTGGTGKTTIARALQHKLATQFSSSSCILHVQQEIERVGIECLRQKYLSELLDEGNTSNGLHFPDKRLEWAKVLLILDDVKNSSQIQELIGGRGNFSQGSRIIVTSRDMHVLKNAEADGIFEVQKMNYQDSLQLFSLNAFKQNCPVEVNADLVEKALEYAQGVPLALEVLGSLLYGRTRKAWESELEKLEKLPDVNILNVLKLSYDGLDDGQKDIFLDIACFYGGLPVDEAVELLDSCGFSADIGMDILKDRCLVSILEDRIVVHDIILEMGMEIVRQQCVDDPRKRSRLWNPEEIYHVFRKNKGTDAIQSIFLNMCRIKKVQLHPNFFKTMHNLRMLYFHKHSSFEEGQSNVILPALLESLPDALKVLHWDEFPQRSLPLDFCPQNLAKLEMRESRLEQLWEDGQELPNLKRLDLSDSWNLIRIPDLSKTPNIEEIILSNCESLTSLPTDLCKLKLLRRFYLSGCSNLEKFPEIDETMENLAVLVLDGTAIQELPQSLHRLVGLEELSLDFCSKLETIPSSIGELTKLCKLDLTCCESLETFPSSIFKLKLTKLDLFGCLKLKVFPEILEPAKIASKEPPSTLDCLVSLQTLSLEGCSGLESLPNSIGNLNLLSELDCSGCGNLTEIPSGIGGLSSLRKLSLQDTGIVSLPENIAYLSSLESLDVSDTGIVNLPENVAHLSSLESLNVSGCGKLECIPQLPPFLKQLLAFNCPSIRRVMSNSRLSRKGTFELYFTNNEEQDPGGHSDVVADARIRIIEDACRFVFYCFPGSAVPDWFPYRGEGNSITMNKDTLDWCNDNQLIGFAVCVVLRLEDMDCRIYRFDESRCTITFESDGRKHILPKDDQVNNTLFPIDLRIGKVVRDHTFLWKYNYLKESGINDKGIFHANNFTFEISDVPYLKSSPRVKECGICPLYTKEKDDNSGAGGLYSLR